MPRPKMLEIFGACARGEFLKMGDVRLQLGPVRCDGVRDTSTQHKRVIQHWVIEHVANH